MVLLDRTGFSSVTTVLEVVLYAYVILYYYRPRKLASLKDSFASFKWELNHVGEREATKLSISCSAGYLTVVLWDHR